jgi:hypothetical protein
MASEKRTLTGEEFVEHLRRRANNAHVFTGIAKAVEGEPDSVMFARSTDCTQWVKIPVDMIDHVEKIETVICQDHTHQAVHLFLKPPQSAEGQAFAALAQLHRAPTFSAGPSAVSMQAATSPPPISCPPGTVPMWDIGFQRWTCVPG